MEHQKNKGCFKFIKGRQDGDNVVYQLNNSRVIPITTMWNDASQPYPSNFTCTNMGLLAVNYTSRSHNPFQYVEANVFSTREGLMQCIESIDDKAFTNEDVIGLNQYTDQYPSYEVEWLLFCYEKFPE